MMLHALSEGGKAELPFPQMLWVCCTLSHLFSPPQSPLVIILCIGGQLVAGCSPFGISPSVARRLQIPRRSGRGPQPAFPLQHFQSLAGRHRAVARSEVAHSHPCQHSLLKMRALCPQFCLFCHTGVGSMC